MILKLRMFSSHPLTVQDMLKEMLTGGIMTVLGMSANKEQDPEHPSRKITKWLFGLKKDFTVPSKKFAEEAEKASQNDQSTQEKMSGKRFQPIAKTHAVKEKEQVDHVQPGQSALETERAEDLQVFQALQSFEAPIGGHAPTQDEQVQAAQPVQEAETEGAQPAESMQSSQDTQAEQPPQASDEDIERLVKRFHEFMSWLHKEGNWTERLDRGNCPSCGNYPEEAVITSCKHLYCEECYCLLIEESSQTDSEENGAAGDSKPTCRACKATIDEAAHCGSIDNFKLNPSAAKKKQKVEPAKKVSRVYGSFGPFGLTRQKKSNSNEDDDEPDEDGDWIKAAAHDMPGAKLTKAREIIASWIAEKPNVKIVVFTQFIDFVRILAAMCEKEKWRYTCVGSPFAVVVPYE